MCLDSLRPHHVATHRFSRILSFFFFGFLCVHAPAQAGETALQVANAKGNRRVARLIEVHFSNTFNHDLTTP